ncbi:L-amino acid amidase [Psilocybe cubensis]|uniref:AB hydrolase-1 domain-containing protein n=2 Tax=Psilocybe cubensis TaxID=181762 RepID=A0A8H7XTU1_PSICU|nr:L-amino acid amidase [Psilocybe cubensis]KAH9474306.1 L-amino acid amidase [Psilocybe cubensis]
MPASQKMRPNLRSFTLKIDLEKLFIKIFVHTLDPAPRYDKFYIFNLLAMDSNVNCGTVDFKVGDETFHTWYKVLGSLKSEKTPIVALHGGPGMTHHYMLFPVVFYDQIGNGASSHILDKPDTFWTVDLFMDELDNLLKYLGIYDNFLLLGHSWGGMLAGNYAASRAPSGLKKLIIANSPASIPSFIAGTNALLDLFPADYVERVRSLEAEGKTDSPVYQTDVMEFYKKHVCTTDPWPQGLVDSFNAVSKNPMVYHSMFGVSEFNITGTLKDWSIVEILHQIPYTTLLISAPLDEVQEIAFLPFFVNIPKVKWVEIPTSTHLAMYEDPERYFDAIVKFFS